MHDCYCRNHSFAISIINKKTKPQKNNKKKPFLQQFGDHAEKSLSTIITN